MQDFIKSFWTKNAKVTAFYYFGSFTLSVGNYLFHLLLMRMLAPEAYGEFLSYVSFFYLLAIPAGTISAVSSKYAADFYGKHDMVKINYFFNYLLRLVFLPSILLSLVVIIAAPYLAIPLKAQSFAFVILGINLVISFVGAIINSYILAFQKFIFQLATGGLSLVLKLVLTYVLLVLGLGPIGGVIAILISAIVSQIVIFLKIKSVVYPMTNKKVKLNINVKKYFSYSLIFSAGSLSLISVDILLVRYFLSPHESGIYSSLTVLGRMIHFGLAPLSALMLPIVAKRYAAKEATKPVLFKLGVVSLLFGFIGVMIFSSFPRFVIKILSGIQYVEGSNLLWGFALSMLLFSLSKLILSYFMAINKEKTNLFYLSAMVLQPLLIIIWHSNMYQVMVINLIVQSILLFSLVVYYGIVGRRIL